MIKNHLCLRSKNQIASFGFMWFVYVKKSVYSLYDQGRFEKMICHPFYLINGNYD